jgi:hypothetical protein
LVCSALSPWRRAEGAHAKWHVEGYVKKLWFLRQTNPIGFGLAIRAVNKLMRMYSKKPQAQLG